MLKNKERNKLKTKKKRKKIEIYIARITVERITVSPASSQGSLGRGIVVGHSLDKATASLVHAVPVPCRPQMHL